MAKTKVKDAEKQDLEKEPKKKIEVEAVEKTEKESSASNSDFANHPKFAKFKK